MSQETGAPPDLPQDLSEALRTLGGTGASGETLAEAPLDALAALLEGATARCGDDLASRRLVWTVLDRVRSPSVVRRIDPAEHGAWSDRMLAAVEASRFTVGPLFRERAATYGSKVLFQGSGRGRRMRVTWRVAAARSERYARGLLALDPQAEGPVAILAENRLETALVDLACLTSGIQNVMIPANATADDVAFMLGHSGVRTLVVSDRRQLEKVIGHRDTLPELRHVVLMDAFPQADRSWLTLDELAHGGEKIDRELPRRRGEAVRPDDRATVMYTSGTTGMPKGIQFSHRNLVFKRFARGLAIPEIGDDDVFLCYLPLFHTFGRFFEMLGCVFWGATYCFLESTSVDSMVRDMQRYRPTVFISVPKKWMQLHELVSHRLPDDADESRLGELVLEVTGGRLRWGLSAAGHLDSEVFRTFQRHGVELMSGFGMTEATGGISMTPPGEYRDDSLGLALPGIECTLAPDGELLIRGPYVMTGYLDPPEGESSFDDEGWFHSGDLMEADPAGHLRLVDRKKEIYKNVKGETIAPQRVENLFRDLESVGRAFLVGDHREYNTLLIYPNPEFVELDFGAMSTEETWAHFRSLVVSVNRFLPPYERIVDFAIIDRDLDPERGELTAKGTPRRQTIVRNFGDTIRLLYRRTELHVNGVELTFPHWLFQTLGLTAQDIRLEAERILIPASGTALTLGRLDDGRVRIGSCLYRYESSALDLGTLLSTPRLWLGNEELVDFVPLEPEARQRPGRAARKIEWCGRVEAFRSSREDTQAVEASLQRTDRDLLDLDRAGRVLATTDDRAAMSAVALLEKVLHETEGPLAEPARLLLSRAADAPSAEVRRRAFRALIPTERENRLSQTLDRFLTRDTGLLDASARSVIAEPHLSPARLEAFVQFARRVATDEDPRDDAFAGGLLRFLADYGSAHPASYRRLRAFLVRMSLFAREPVRPHAEEAVESLQHGFRRWLGPNASVAVDPETGGEYRWDDVVVFSDEVDPLDRERLLSVLKETAFLREALFLFSKGVLIRLSDIPLGGVWIRLLGALHGKSVYRISIQTRFQGHYDLAVNVNHELTRAQVQEEIQWLIVSGELTGSGPLVEDFGGYWSQQDLWTEEFVAGDTLARAMRRLSRRQDQVERFQQLWSFLAWTALAAYVDFWHRSGCRWEIADPRMTNVVVPTDDFQTGVRIVSVSSRRPHGGLLEMLRDFRGEFIDPAQEQYPALAGLVGWDLIFSSVLEILGEERGLAALDNARTGAGSFDDEMLSALDAYIVNVRARGFLPRRLFFAVKRYRRWMRLSDEATSQARARTLREMYDTYGLAALSKQYPETRLRFFRETVFRDGPEALVEGLEAIIARARSGEWQGDELQDALADLRARLELQPDDDYFLARLSLPHLRPEDAAGFVHSRLGGKHQSEIVVTTEDEDGNTFRIRHALNPKEVERLHRLFLASKVDVRFRPEHRYLVTLNERGHIVGGIYYDIEEGSDVAHLEKIVVAERHRRRGVADALMEEFFNRLRAADVRTVTTGFFRPEYFYAYGFRIEKRYAGLVKDLTETESKPGTASP